MCKPQPPVLKCIIVWSSYLLLISSCLVCFKLIWVLHHTATLEKLNNYINRTTRATFYFFWSPYMHCLVGTLTSLYLAENIKVQSHLDCGDCETIWTNVVKFKVKTDVFVIYQLNSNQTISKHLSLGFAFWFILFFDELLFLIPVLCVLAVCNVTLWPLWRPAVLLFLLSVGISGQGGDCSWVASSYHLLYILIH